VSPVTVIGLEAAVPVWPPSAVLVRSVAVTVYPLIGEPPVKVGGVNDMLARPLALVAIGPDPFGGEGGPTGVTGSDGADRGPVPLELVAETVNV
jgi:hypothetical protein